MAQGANNLTNLFAELNRFGQQGEYERALRTSNKILQLPEGREDAKAFHCKIVCLLQLGKFEDVLKHIGQNPKFAEILTFEKAYAQYRLNRTKDALQTLQALANPTDREKELLGQVLYRLEEYKSCFNVYRDLVKNTQDDYEEERETNLSAVMASLRLWNQEDVDDLGLSEDTYELCYNNACCLIGKEDYSAALEKLKKAESMCRQTFEDDQDAGEEDMDTELGVIRVQMGYVLQRLGKNDESLKLYNQVLKNKPSDIGLSAVASNNIVTINKDQNVFDSKKKMKVATGDGLQQKLTSPQRQTIALNQCLLYMYMNQTEQCHSTARNLQKHHKSLDTPALIDAAQYVRDKQVPSAIEVLKKRVDAGSASIELKLTLSQLYLTEGSVYLACDILRDLGGLSHKPGVVSTLVTLYLSQEDMETAGEVLEEAVARYKKNAPHSEELGVLMRAHANFLQVHGSPEEASRVLEELRKRDPSDMKTLAQLISAYAKFDPNKAQEVSKQLPSPDEMAHEVDVDALENSVSTLGPKYIKKALGKPETSPKPTSPTSAAESLVQKKRRKKKKGKLPKNYDANVDPDPERWLPRRERSYFKGKRRDKRKDIGKGTQGAAGTPSADLDASKPASTSASGSEVGSPRPGTTQQQPSSTGSATAPAGPRGQKPSGKQQKKKKKGNKW